jgi:hypothetical protein
MTSILEAKKTIENIILAWDPRISGLGVSQDKEKIIIYTAADKNGCPFINIPNKMAGYRVEIICLNPLVPGTSLDPSPGGISNKLRYRPICGGISAAHRDVSAGTLGAIVEDAITGEPLLLSNNHVFANCSTEETPNATIGDPIYQPGRADGADIDKDVVATLLRWIPYNTIGDNLVDAAVATPKPGILTSDLLLAEDGRFIEPGEMTPITSKTHVRKYGRTSGFTNGDIIDWDFSTTMTYPGGIKVKYVDQLLAKLDTYSGDSGSILLDDNDNVVGMVYGGTIVNGERYAVANKIRNVAALAHLKFT